MNLFFPPTHTLKKRLTFVLNREHHERVMNRHHSTRHHHSFQDAKSRFAFAAAPVQHSFENFGKVSRDFLQIYSIFGSFSYNILF